MDETTQRSMYSESLCIFFHFFIFKLVSFMSSQASTHNNEGMVQAIRHFNLVPRVLSYPSLRRENLGTRSSPLQKQKGNWDELTFTKTSGIVTRDTEKKLMYILIMVYLNKNL